MRRSRIALGGVVLALIVLIALSRETGVDTFFDRLQLPPDTVLTTATGSPTQFAINIDPETSTAGVIDITPPPPPPPTPRPAPVDTTRVRPEHDRPDPRVNLDLGDLLDQDAGAHGGPSSTQVAAVPPRPVEIQWPETRKLKECIGQSVNVDIWVSEDGRVKDVKIDSSAILPACADAALAAARHIRFEPGRAGGVAVAMWTKVRIDFQRRD